MLTSAPAFAAEHELYSAEELRERIEEDLLEEERSSARAIVARFCADRDSTGMPRPSCCRNCQQKSSSLSQSQSLRRLRRCWTLTRKRRLRSRGQNATSVRPIGGRCRLLVSLGQHEPRLRVRLLLTVPGRMPTMSRSLRLSLLLRHSCAFFGGGRPRPAKWRSARIWFAMACMRCGLLFDWCMAFSAETFACYSCSMCRMHTATSHSAARCAPSRYRFRRSRAASVAHAPASASPPGAVY